MTSVLVVGSGGREHAIAAAFSRSSRVDRVLVAPGNGGTATTPGMQNVPVQADDLEGLVELARTVDLTFVGPEIPLAAGLVDRLQAAGCRVFGPTAAAARLEASKAFAKDFMVRHGIQTAGSATFTEREAALAYLRANWGPLVLKASGLAAGKGVLLPTTLEDAERGLTELMEGYGAEVVIEDLLVGEEVSLLAFCDGVTARVMPPCRDHKRIFDGDRGPNTGGMGAFAPTPALTPAQVVELQAAVLQRAVDGMRADGTPYVGVLYAGLMLTERGPQVLEFNSRFGDPETQVLLPLLASDLLEVCEAALAQELATVSLRWHPGAAATVVLASAGYPDSGPRGVRIEGIEQAMALEDVEVFHAGTRKTSSGCVTAGGRVLCVTGRGPTLAAALERAYAGADRITFEGCQLRRDIGASQT